MAFIVQAKDATGKVLISVEGRPEDLKELLEDVQKSLTRHIMDRVTKSLPDDIVQPVSMTWGEGDA